MDSTMLLVSPPLLTRDPLASKTSVVRFIVAGNGMCSGLEPGADFQRSRGAQCLPAAALLCYEP
jgi:hypothetical protein